jgi:DNA-binding NarL/FixJ family response regulator
MLANLGITGQADVIKLVTKGLSNLDIAAASISPRTP